MRCSPTTASLIRSCTSSLDFLLKSPPFRKCPLMNSQSPLVSFKPISTGSNAVPADHRIVEKVLPSTWFLVWGLGCRV